MVSFLLLSFLMAASTKRSSSSRVAVCMGPRINVRQILTDLAMGWMSYLRIATETNCCTVWHRVVGPICRRGKKLLVAD